MTASIDVARPAKAPGAMISRGPGEPLPPRPTRPARRQQDAILIVILLAAAARSARLAKAAGAQISAVPDGPPPQPVSRQRAEILIVVALAAEADLAAVAMVAIVLAAIRDPVRDSQVIPRTLSWYFGPVSTWHMRRLRRRYLRQQMLDAPARLSTFGPAGNPVSNGANDGSSVADAPGRTVVTWYGTPGLRSSPARMAAGRGPVRGWPHEPVGAVSRIRDRPPRQRTLSGCGRPTLPGA